MATGKLYLIPAWLHEGNSTQQFPESTLTITKGLTHFIVERAKTARHFLKRIGYAVPFDDTVMTELNKHGADQLERLLAPCMEGHDVGLISEAGVPGVADPGGLITACAHDHRIEVVPLIGPSSLLLALMASGMNGQRFTFHGYLERDERALVKQLRALEQDSRQLDTTHLFIETPYRNDKLLDVLLKTLAPSTRLCVAANLTAADQEIQSLTIQDWRGAKKSVGKKPAVYLLFAGNMGS